MTNYFLKEFLFNDSTEWEREKTEETDSRCSFICDLLNEIIVKNSDGNQEKRLIDMFIDI